MEEHNLTNFNGFGVLVFIDEFRSLENNSLDKKEKDKMVKSLIELSSHLAEIEGLTAHKNAALIRNQDVN